MARHLNRLTHLKVTTVKAKGMYSDGGGLMLQVTQTGAKSWVFRYKTGAKARDMGLGPLHDISLAEARELAAECRKLRLQGIDPIAARNAQREQARLQAATAVTFDAAKDAYIEAHEPSWRNAKHREQWRNTLKTYASPVLGSLPVQQIDTAHVLKVIEGMWHKKPETASRIRGRIEAILDWSKARGYRTGENPARWRGHLANVLPPHTKVRRVRHHPAMPYSEVAAFMAELRQRTNIAASALQFVILTAVRTGEGLGARWSEFNLQEAVWTIQGERMKSGREHRVPLSGAALAILKDMQRIRQSEYVFPGQLRGKPLSDMALLMMLRNMGRDDVTTHGFRSSFRDWAAEATNFPREVAEAALAHVVGDKVEAAYRRGDLFVKRLRMMEAWAQFVSTEVKNDSERVVSISHHVGSNAGRILHAVENGSGGGQLRKRALDG